MMKLKQILSGAIAGLLIASSAALTAAALEPHGTGIKCRNWLTNDPNYTFSEAYKKSVWYDNFSTLELGPNQRNNILSIAISQLGYHEGDVGDYSGLGTSGGNCIEYARLLIPNYNDNAYEWCACFVNWCLNQAHIDYASSEISCWKWVEELKNMGMFENSVAYGGTYTPKPADMIFFNWKNTNTGSGHIGYVLYTTDTHVFTVEGNADNNVTVRSYTLDNPCVIGYGTPPYEEGDVPTMDLSYKNGMPRGEYILNVTGRNLTKDKTSNRICRMPLGARVTLLGVDGNYAKVIYGEHIGYLPTAGLYLMAESVGSDTLTFDANGGEGAPDPQEVPIGASATIGDTTPTLEGDTFLGWSYVPHNYKVDLKPGDEIVTAGDTTLYAVWEKHSLKLASDVMEAGGVAEFARPSAIENSGALLLGAMADLTAFDTAKGDTAVDFYEDETEGRVISLISTAESKDPFTVLSYKMLCDSMQLAPVTADNVDYIVMKVKDVSMNNLAFELFYDCGKGAVHSVSRTLKNTDGWQYIVFDMSNAEGWEGIPERLRLDWQKASNVAGNTLLISEIYFAANEATADAIQDGLYVFPPQPKLPIPAETESVTENETESVSDTTNATGSDTTDTSSESSDTTVAESDTDPAGRGCASTVIGTATLLITLAGGACVMARKKKD